MAEWAGSDGGAQAGGQDDSRGTLKKWKKTKTNLFVRSESELARWPHRASEEERLGEMNM